MSEPTIAEMTGASNFQRPELPRLDEIQLQGSYKESTVDKDTGETIKPGTFKFTDRTSTKESGYLYTNKQLDSNLEIIILKIRRDMQQYRKGEDMLRTSEHNTKKDKITLFGAKEGIVRGTAEEIRDRYQQLKTRQILYAFVPSLNKVCRVVIKGTQQMKSETEKGERAGLFDYLRGFNKNKSVHQYVTKLSGMKIEGEDYYSVHFSEGEKLDAEKLARVEEMIKELYTRIKEVDDYYVNQKTQSNITPDSQVQADDIPEIQMDEPMEDDLGDDINPEDIPF